MSSVKVVITGRTAIANGTLRFALAHHSTERDELLQENTREERNERALKSKVQQRNHPTIKRGKCTEDSRRGSNGGLRLKTKFISYIWDILSRLGLSET
jgi:hypothetical protein